MFPVSIPMLSPTRGRSTSRTAGLLGAGVDDIHDDGCERHHRSGFSLTIDPRNAWTNLGSIRLASGASLYLYGPMTTTGLGSISNSGGAVYLDGTLDNSGETLNGATPLGSLPSRAARSAGARSLRPGVEYGRSGTLSGVTFDGPLNLTSLSGEQYVILADGTTVVGSSGSGARDDQRHGRGFRPLFRQFADRQQRHD